MKIRIIIYPFNLCVSHFSYIKNCFNTIIVICKPVYATVSNELIKAKLSNRFAFKNHLIVFFFLNNLCNIFSPNILNGTESKFSRAGIKILRKFSLIIFLKVTSFLFHYDYKWEFCTVNDFISFLRWKWRARWRRRKKKRKRKKIIDACRTKPYF